MERKSWAVILTAFPGLAQAHGPVEVIWYIVGCGLLYVWSLGLFIFKKRRAWPRIVSLVAYVALTISIWGVAFIVEDELDTYYHWLLPVLLIGGWMAINKFIEVVLPVSRPSSADNQNDE